MMSRSFTGKQLGYSPSRAVQHGLERENTGKLQSLWMELPAYCNLHCAYCFIGDVEGPRAPLGKDDFVSILDQAAAMGVDSIGIPGAGEPFFGPNYALSLWFLGECAARGMYVTLFTTGEFITPELAAILYELPVELMLKGNSLDPDVQDRFVSNPDRGRIVRGYGVKRNRALQVLMNAGFNDPVAAQRFGRVSRMALVTSIMASEDGSLSNLSEVEEVYRWCRQRNVIADIDTILERGRAPESGLCGASGQILGVLKRLRQIATTEYGDSEAALSSTYVETVCDRYHHHLYVDMKGRIRPCIGAMDVDLGNIREGGTLAQAWDSSERRIIRERRYGGKCATCDNFRQRKCHSCLGRRTVATGEEHDLTNRSLLTDGEVTTTGCPLYSGG